jgi:hypothetical protein
MHTHVLYNAHPYCPVKETLKAADHVQSNVAPNTYACCHTAQLILQAKRQQTCTGACATMCTRAIHLVMGVRAMHQATAAEASIATARFIRLMHYSNHYQRNGTAAPHAQCTQHVTAPANHNNHEPHVDRSAAAPQNNSAQQACAASTNGVHLRRRSVL